MKAHPRFRLFLAFAIMLLISGVIDTSGVKPAQAAPAAGSGPSDLQCVPPERAVIPPSEQSRYVKGVGASESPLFYSAGVPEEIFVAGKPIDFTLTIKNGGSIPAVLSFSTAQRYDVVIWNDDCVEVWRWSRGRAFAQVLGSLSVPAGGATTFNIRWDQRDQAGRAVRAGTYEAKVVFLGKRSQRSAPMILPPLILAVR